MTKKDARQKRRVSIQATVVVLALLFALFICIAVSLSNIRSLSRGMRQSELQAAEYALQVAAGRISSSVEEIDTLVSWSMTDTTVRTYIFSPQPARVLTNATYTTVATQYASLAGRAYVQRYLITDGHNRVIQQGTASSISRPLNAETISRLPGLGEGEADIAWTQIVADPLILSSQVRGIPITQTFTNSTGRTARVYVSVSPALITDCVRNYTIGGGEALYWYMGGNLYEIRNGSLLPQGTENLTPLTSLSNAEMLDAQTELYTVERDGKKYTLVRYPVSVAHGLYIAQLVETPSLWQQLPQMRPTLLLSVLTILAMGGLLSLLLRRTVGAPIRALQKQIGVIAEGNFTTEPSIEWNNELGDVGRGINSLSRSVTALMDKRLEDAQQKQDLEYRMLQNQINPHFIYNTLNSIKWMATIQHATGISEMTTALSRLLKSVSKSNERLVPLTDELALLNDYFTIQQYRYGGTIDLDVTYIEDERICAACLIPRFTLQPLTENAIFHGIEPKGRAGSIQITIATDPVTGDVLIRLWDDGVGMTPEQIEKALHEPGPEEAAAKYRHVGLWNVHRRLQYSFGDEYGLSIASTLGESTTVTVRLPYTPPAEEENL